LLAYCDQRKGVNQSQRNGGAKLQGERSRDETDLGALKVHVVVADLENDSNQVRQRDVVSVRKKRIGAGKSECAKCKGAGTNLAGDSGDAAIISLMDIRNKPPVSATALVSSSAPGEAGDVLLLTMSMYSGSVGQIRFSRQKRSIPCPRWRFSSSSVPIRS
jgi:hypothetical protein